MPESEQQASDDELIERCLAGDPSAWSALRQRHLADLAGYVRRLLQGQQNVSVRGQEIAEEVLESLLVPDKNRLLRYQPGQAPFGAYLRVLALQAVQLDYRKNKRRKAAEGTLGEGDPADSGADDEATALFREDFIASLRPEDQAYCRHILLGEPDLTGSYKFSAAEGYEIRRRILNAAKEFCKRYGGGKKNLKKNAEVAPKRGVGAHYY